MEKIGIIFASVWFLQNDTVACSYMLLKIEV